MKTTSKNNNNNNKEINGINDSLDAVIEQENIEKINYEDFYSSSKREQVFYYLI